MGVFIEIVIDYSKCKGIEECGKCIQVCPVNIFDEDQNKPIIVEENVDECTFCNRCLEECQTDAIQIKKLYESAIK